MPFDDRQQRIGRNEALFREVNERLERLHDSFDVASEETQFLCECGDASCAQPIELTREEYERIRADSALFAIVAGHEQLDVEEIVEENDRFHVVRKQAGEAHEIAARLDPRS
jgi:hypothetical protein